MHGYLSNNEKEMLRRKYKYDAKDITHNMMCTYEEGTGDCQVQVLFIPYKCK